MIVKNIVKEVVDEIASEVFNTLFKNTLYIQPYRELDFLIESKIKNQNVRISAGFNLIGTHYFLYMNSVGRQWFEEIGTDRLERVLLQDILDNVEEKIQEKIIFHLDLLTESGSKYILPNKIPGISGFINPGIRC